MGVFYQHRAPLPLSAARTIIREALAAARERELKPMCVVVLDAGGHPIALEREDGAGIGRCDIATGKAWGALGLGTPSGAFGEANRERPAFLSAVASASDGRSVPVAGGVLALDAEQRIIGAVGVSGDSSDADEAVAVAALEAADLAAGASG